ncbi:MAG: T9SS type A sorting domain-containing protein [Bacteroidales bacterium]|nr:T9SS type A sorting domain-containing protein [Bacteroidales bacterium]
MPKLISVPDGATQPIFSPYFNDKNLAPETEMPTYGAVGYNLESRQLIDSAFMRNLMGDSAEQDFIFEDGFYPRLRHMDERPGRLAASPILLYLGENADSVVHPFYVDTNYGVRWVSLSPELVEIVGDSGFVRMPVDKDSVVRIEAWKEDFSKHVYLTIRARKFVDNIEYDTVCPGDSVKMINSYARKEGWNYDVVWGEGNDTSPDTVYRLYIHHYTTYHDTFTDSCYIEELPYAVGGRPIQDFGTYTENLVTTAGCDSVREYSLLRRWRHYRVQVSVRGEGSVNVTDTVLREDGKLQLSFMAEPCHEVETLLINGVPFAPVSTYLLDGLQSDHRIEVTFAPRWQTARLEIVDSVTPPCGDKPIRFSCLVNQEVPISLYIGYDAMALSAGFRDTVLEIRNGKFEPINVQLPIPTVPRPGRYGINLRCSDMSGCLMAEDALTFEIPYPSNIIVQKWNNVLAVLSAEYNGGYEFSGYQWYKNGEPMEGETRPYYYAKPYLRSTDTYAVLLERASDGLKLQTCGLKRKGYPKELSLELRPNPTAAGEEVQVSVIGKPEAEGTIEVFDDMGKPVYERAFRRSHTLRLSVQPGSYVVRVRDAKSTWTATGKLLVQ